MKLKRKYISDNVKLIAFFNGENVKILPVYSSGYVKSIIFAVVIKDFRYG